MAQVGLTTSAYDLGALHAVRVVGGIDNAAFADGFVETWPAATAFEFGVAAEQRVAADGAIIRSDLPGLFKRAAPGVFRTLVPGDLKDIRRQDLFPLLVGQVHGRAIRMRVYRVIFLIFGHFFAHIT